MKRRLMIQKIGGHVMAVKLFEQQFCQNPEKCIIKSTKDKKKIQTGSGRDADEYCSMEDFCEAETELGHNDGISMNMRCL